MPTTSNFPLLRRDLWFHMLPVVDAERHRILPLEEKDGSIVLMLDCEFGNPEPDTGLWAGLGSLWLMLRHPFTAPPIVPRNYESAKDLIANLEFRFNRDFRLGDDREYPRYREHFDIVLEYYYLKPTSVEDQAKLKFANGERYRPEVHGTWGPIPQEVIGQALSERQAEWN